MNDPLRYMDINFNKSKVPEQLEVFSMKFRSWDIDRQWFKKDKYFSLGIYNKELTHENDYSAF